MDDLLLLEKQKIPFDRARGVKIEKRKRLPTDAEPSASSVSRAALRRLGSGKINDGRMEVGRVGGGHECDRKLTFLRSGCCVM